MNHAHVWEATRRLQLTKGRTPWLVVTMVTFVCFPAVVHSLLNQVNLFVGILSDVAAEYAALTRLWESIAAILRASPGVTKTVGINFRLGVDNVDKRVVRGNIVGRGLGVDVDTKDRSEQCVPKRKQQKEQPESMKCDNMWITAANVKAIPLLLLFHHC